MPPNIVRQLQQYPTGPTFATATDVNDNSYDENSNGPKEEQQEEQPWVCPASQKSLRTVNPIRAIVDPILASVEAKNDNGKEFISLALGDPTTSSSLQPCPVALQEISKNLSSSTGYVNACGTNQARQAIARHHNATSPDHVIIANGCSGALELVLTALLDPSSILLVPRPGFPLYQVIAESHGASVLHYNLLPDQRWECDLDHMGSILRRQHDGGKQIRGIVLNNPSNPTGSVYSMHHLRAICRLAKKFRLPIIADEVYGDLTFGHDQFHSVSTVEVDVPKIVTSGCAKQYLLPGWRLGWAVFFDNSVGSLQPVLDGAKRLAQVVLGASHLCQSTIPPLLSPSDTSLLVWKASVKQTLERQAMVLCGALSHCYGLHIIRPQGSMYAMVEIDVDKFNDGLLTDDLAFTKLLLEEENVFVLPGSAFGVSVSSSNKTMFRVVYCASEETLLEAAKRISQFCYRHAATTTPGIE